MIRLTTTATEGSTYIAVCTFEDDQGTATTPTTAVTWVLQKTDGTQISTGSETAEATVNIAIKGADLAVSQASGTNQSVVLKVSTEYTSSIAGAGCPLVEFVEIPIINDLSSP